MRSYISPIGYDSARVTRPVISHGLDTDDRIILLRPERETDDARASQAVRDVKRMTTQIEPEVEIDLKEIPHDDFQEAVLRISDVFEDNPGELIVNLSGGARDIFATLCIASIVHVDRINTVLSFSDIDGDVRSVDLPNLTVDVPPSAIETLRQIDENNDKISISELSDQLDIAKSTVTRHLQHLESRGLVETWLEGKPKYARITFSGRLLAQTRD
ncbi:MAG: CRISPR-associated CARF protein Csa3 [Halobacteriales archaeon]